MAKGPSSKKVARAARAGGGRVRGAGQRSFLFPSVIGVIIVLGVLLIAFARADRREATAVPPQIGDHWHAAFGITLCGEVSPPILEFENREGVHTHGDGVIHIHPFSSNGAGRNATLGLFLKGGNIELSDTAISVGDKRFENGDKCGDKEGRVVVAKWDRAQDDTEEPELFTEDLTDIRFLKDGEAYTIAFAPEGEEIAKPESAANLDELGAIDSGQSSPSSTPEDTTSSTEPQASTSSTGATSTTASTTPSP
jgi:hypothetical protein